MPFSRRSLLAALGVTLPLGLGNRSKAAHSPAITPCTVRFLPFEEAVRRAFADLDTHSSDGIEPCRRVDVGHSDLIRAGIQGCHNDRPFAGFPAGQLRLVRIQSEPGPPRQGIRLYVTTVDITLSKDPSPGMTSRPLNFASLPPVPILA